MGKRPLDSLGPPPQQPLAPRTLHPPPVPVHRLARLRFAPPSSSPAIRRDMLAGLAAGGGVLLAVSFAVGGLRWPMEYFHTLTDGRVHPDPAKMPNLHGLLSDVPMGFVLQALLTAAIVVAAWQVARRSSFHYALAVALSGRLLISYHAYLSDCALLLPAAMIIYTQATNRWLQLLAALLLTPFVYFFILAPPPASHVLQLTILAFFGTSVVIALRKPARAREAEAVA